MAPYLHPEFGGFCPTSRLRRELRIVALSVLFGATAGAVGVIGLNAGHSPLSAVRLVSSAVPTGEAARASVSSSAEGSNSQIQNRVSTQIRPIDLAPSEAGAETKALPGACLDGTASGKPCSFFKPHRVRVRALNDGPDTARIAVGRIAVPPAESTLDPAPAAQSSPSPKPLHENPASAARAEQKSSDDRTPSISREPSKKPQKTARGRQRNQRGNDNPGSADPWAAQAENSYGTSGRAYAREASYGRRGFWDWSW